jgi:hypothetical protein
MVRDQNDAPTIYIDTRLVNTIIIEWRGEQMDVHTLYSMIDGNGT